MPEEVQEIQQQQLPLDNKSFSKQVGGNMYQEMMTNLLLVAFMVVQMHHQKICEAISYTNPLSHYFVCYCHSHQTEVFQMQAFFWWKHE